jgi:hypothetical protein
MLHKTSLERVGEIRNAYEVFVGKPEGSDHSEDLGMVYGRYCLKWTLKDLYMFTFT